MLDMKFGMTSDRVAELYRKLPTGTKFRVVLASESGYAHCLHCVTARAASLVAILATLEKKEKTSRKNRENQVEADPNPWELLEKFTTISGLTQADVKEVRNAMTDMGWSPGSELL